MTWKSLWEEPRHATVVERARVLCVVTSNETLTFPSIRPDPCSLPTGWEQRPV